MKEVNMTNTMEHSKTLNDSEIAVVAYQMWEAAGHPASRDLQFWLDAEAQLGAATKALAVAPAAPVAPTAHPSPVDSKNSSADKAAKVPFGFRQVNPSKSQQKGRRF
jgi:hypothetical protein